MRPILALAMLILPACTPQVDENAQRVEFSEARAGSSEPVASPDTQAAVWSPFEQGQLLFGNVGEAPFVSLACEQGADDTPLIRFVRHVSADAEAQAMMALIGNGSSGRVPVDATWRGNRWRWEGVLPADAPDWDALTGGGSLEVTVPGAGTVALPASRAPGEFIARCRDAPVL